MGRRAKGRAALFREKVTDEAAVIFVMDAGEEFGAELLYCIRTIEGQTFVHLAATEVAGHALGLKYGFDLRIEVNSGQRC